MKKTIEFKQGKNTLEAEVEVLPNGMITKVGKITKKDKNGKIINEG